MLAHQVYMMQNHVHCVDFLKFTVTCCAYVNKLFLDGVIIVLDHNAVTYYTLTYIITVQNDSTLRHWQNLIHDAI